MINTSEIFIFLHIIKNSLIIDWKFLFKLHGEKFNYVTLIFLSLELDHAPPEWSLLFCCNEEHLLMKKMSGDNSGTAIICEWNQRGAHFDVTKILSNKLFIWNYFRGILVVSSSLQILRNFWDFFQRTNSQIFCLF